MRTVGWGVDARGGRRGIMTVRNAVAAGLALVAATATPFANSFVAHAESPPPFGFWVTADGGEQLLITQDAQCSLADGYGNITTSGSCTWNATYAGGIMTIYSNQLYQPAPIYFNVLWVDPSTITVEGDVFYRQG